MMMMMLEASIWKWPNQSRKKKSKITTHRFNAKLEEVVFFLNSSHEQFCFSIEPLHRENAEQIPLIEYIVRRYGCSTKEVQVLLESLKTRREIIEHLKSEVTLITNHLRPKSRNFIVHCHDITTQSSSTVPALRGYLNITVGGIEIIFLFFDIPGSCILLCEAQFQTCSSLFSLCDPIRRRNASIILPVRSAQCHK